MVMGEGKIPACSVIPSDGSDTTSGLNENETKVKPFAASRQAQSGNKCGHDPKKHRFYKKPAHQKRRFHVIEESIRRVKRNLASPFEYPVFNQLLYNQAKGRKIRSEAQEAGLALLLPAIADTVNLVRMELGYWEGNQFINYNYNKYVELTGMSKIRVGRHMRALQKRGIIDVKNIVEVLDDGYRTEKVIITVSDKLFALLGLDKQYLEDRERAIRNRNKIESQIDANEKYRELYRARKVNAAIKQTKDALKELGNHLVKKLPSLSKGNGEAIKNAISNLLSKGYSIQDATQIVRMQYYPPP
jgi:DNA-binding transcriptional ArsR family regulator